MNEKQIIRELISLRDYNQSILAEKAGLKRQSNVGEMLRSKNLRVDNLIRLLNAMDCDLVVKSRLKDKREWEVTLDDSEKVE